MPAAAGENGVDGLTQAMPDTTAATVEGIALDLAPSTTPYRHHDSLSVRVERLPVGARLSKGRNNGDRSWSLAIDELDDLLYLPPDGMAEPHTLTVKIISVDSDGATTLEQFDVPISPDGAAIPDSTAAEKTDTAAAADVTLLRAQLAEQIEELTSLREEAIDAATAHAAETAALRESHHMALEAQAAENETRLSETLEKRLGEAQASWEAEQQSYVAAAVKEAVEKAEAETLARLEQTNDARLSQELGRRLADARVAMENEQEARIAAAVQDAAQRAEAAAKIQAGQANEAKFTETLEQRLAEAQASWDAEQQGRISAAVEDALQRSEAETLARLEQTNEARLSQELGRRLAAARASLETEQEGRVALAVREAVKKAEADTVARLEQANDAHISKEIERRLGEARATMDTARQDGIAAAVQEAVQKAEAETQALRDQVAGAEARHAQEVERRLGEAHATWEAEQQDRTAAAVQDAVRRTEADAAIRLEQAQQELRVASARDLADMSTRYTQAETALEELRRQSTPSQEAEADRLAEREELAAAQTAIQERDAELIGLRQETENLSAELARRTAEAEAAVQAAASPSYREAELEFRLNEVLAETDAALAEQRSAWDREREELLAQSEEKAVHRVNEAFEQWQQETQDALARARQEWLDGEATRLAVAEAQWREKVGIQKSRGALKRVAARQRRFRFPRRLLRYGIIAAGLGAAIMLYPRIEPMVVDQWWPQINSYKSEIEPTIRKTGADIESWVSNLTAAPEPRAAIRVAVANVRARPSRTAPLVTTLPRNTEITLLERQGDWVLARMGGKTGKQGWLHNSLIKDIAAGR